MIYIKIMYTVIQLKLHNIIRIVVLCAPFKLHVNTLVVINSTRKEKDMIALTEKRTFKKTEVHDILFSIFEHYGDLVLNGMRILTDSTGLWYTDFNNKFGFYDRETGEEIGITIDLNNIHQINDMFIEYGDE